MKRNKNKIRLFLIFLLILEISLSLKSGTKGQTHQTNIGCGANPCHRGIADPLTEIFITSKSGFKVAPNQSVDITIRVKNSSFSFAGINAGVKISSASPANIGTISNLGTGCQLVDGEFTHTEPMQFIGDGYDFTFTWTAPLEEGQYYIQVSALAVNNNGNQYGDIWNTASQKITVTSGESIEINNFNNSESVCQGSNQIVTWKALGFTNVKIELSSNAGKVYNTTLFASCQASKGVWNWNVSDKLETGNQYKFKLSNSDNPDIFVESKGVFSIKQQNLISSQPISKTLCIGSNATFDILAKGENLQYVWQKNGINIPNSNSNSFSIKNVILNDSGKYTCKISGDCGEPIISNIADLKIFDQPKINKQPLSQLVCIYDTLILYAEATGGELTYEWYKENQLVKNENSNTLTIANFQNANVGNYKLLAKSNVCNTTIESDVVEVSRGFIPKINLQPNNIIACENSSVTFSLIASGTNLLYQWYRNDKSIKYSNSYFLRVSKIDSSDVGNYYCRISGFCGNPIYSNIVSLSIKNLPNISINLSNKIGIEGESTTFSINNYKYLNKVNYQWYKDSLKLVGNSNPIFEIKNLTLLDSGNYYCEVSNECTKVKSDAIFLSVKSINDGVLKVENDTLNYHYKLLSSNIMNDLTLSNKGNKTLVLTKAYLTGNNIDDFVLYGFNLPYNIEPHKSISYQIGYSSKIRGINNAFLNLETSEGQKAKIILLGNSFIQKADVSINKTILNLNAKINESVVGKVTIQNNSNSEETFSNPFYLSDSNFKVISPKLPFTLGSKETKEIEVQFSPQSKTIYTCTAKIPIDLAEDSLVFNIIGSTDFSNIDLINDNSLNYTIFPNPISNTAEIKFYGLNSRFSQFKIFNCQGEIVKRFDLNDNCSIQWECKNDNSNYVSSGIYYGILQYGTESKVLLLNVIR
ncbi:MAG: immunoglobulin domain-containing protein [Candidatus Kapabacteria bacterium]|nr:immunoglobulin domain-containing protein [Candidatus Kapabacteria bacterium]